MDTFTWITGIASLIGFGIQLLDLFPQHKDARQSILLFSAGLFLGSLLNAVEPASIKIQIRLTGFVLLISVLTAVWIGLLLIAAFTNDPNKRSMLFGACGFGLIPYIFILLFGSLFSGTVEPPKVEMQRITSSELLFLSEKAIEHKDFERAIAHLETMQSRIPPHDERSDNIEKKIQEIKQLEIQQHAK